MESRPLEDPLGAVLERDGAPPPAAGRATAVLVAGVEGSGPAALVRALERLGCDLPRSAAIAELHREVYGAAGLLRDDWLALGDSWQSAPGAPNFRERALGILEHEFGSSPLFVLSAPRLALLLRDWLDVLEVFGAAPHVVVPIGSPWVPADAPGDERRPADTEQLVWLRHILEAEAASRYVPRSFVRDEDLFGRWEYAVSRVGDDLSIAWPRWSPGVEGELARVFSSEAAEEAQGADRRRRHGVATWVDRTYAIVERWAGGVVLESDRQALDEIRVSFETGAPALAAPLRTALAAEEQARVALAEREAQLAGLEASLEEAAVAQSTLTRSLEEKDVAAAEAAERAQLLEARLQEREAELASLREGEAELRARLSRAEARSAAAPPAFATSAPQAAQPEPEPEPELEPSATKTSDAPDRATLEAYAALRGISPDDLRRESKLRAESLRERLQSGKLGELVARAAALDPLVDRTWRAARPRIAPLHSRRDLAQLVALDALQEQAGRRRARGVLVLPRDRWGTAPRIEGHIAAALAELWRGGEELLVVKTDDSTTPSIERFPAGCRHVDFAGVAADLEYDRKRRLLVDFLRSLCPAHVFNVNSNLFWHTLELYGRALAESTRLYACVFCDDQNEHGHRFGYPSNFFYRQFDFLTALVADSEYLVDELRTRFCVPQSQAHRVVTLHTPLLEPPRQAESPPDTPRRRQIFWSGRFDRQKRVDIVLRLAELMPEVDFRLWGEAVLDGFGSEGGVPSNVSLEGKYAGFSDLPLDECDVWLYTSQWDGVPNVLLEAAAAGLPLVASLVEGTADVLVDGLCERIPDIEDVDAYRDAIARVLADPAAARERAGRLRELTLVSRTPQRLRDEVAELVGGVSA